MNQLFDLNKCSPWGSFLAIIFPFCDCHIFPLPALSPQSRVALPADRQEDELGNLQQPGAGRRPAAPAAVPPAGDAAAGARWGGAAPGLQAGGDSQGSPCCLPGPARRLRYGGAEDHAGQRPGDLSFHGFPHNTETKQLSSPLLTCFNLTGEFGRAQAGGRGHVWECCFITRMSLPTKRLRPDAG